MRAIIRILRFLITGHKPGDLGYMPADWKPHASALRSHNHTLRQIR